MKKKFLGILLVSLSCLLTACGSKPHDRSITENAGVIAFTLSWNTSSVSPGALKAPPPGADICAYYQIDTINASVVDSSGRTVAAGTWPCSAHSGTISDVPAGTMNVTIDGLAGTTVLWRGQTTGFTVVAGETVNVGTVAMDYVGSDATAPTVRVAAPTDNAVKQKLNVTISALFSEAVVSDSVSNAVSVTSGTNQIDGVVSYNSASHIATFRPSSSLTYSTLYTISVGTAVEDLAGHQLSAPFSWSFTTNDYPDRFAGNIPLGGSINGMSLTLDGSYLYVSNGPANSVSVINMASYSVIATISTGTYPGAITVAPGGSHVYVANAYSNTVSVIRTSDNTVIETISVGTSPSNIVVTPDGSQVYVSNYYANSVSVIRTSDHTVTQTIFIRYYMNDLCASPNGEFIYVLHDPSGMDFGSNSISVIKTSDNTVVGTYRACSLASGILSSSDGEYIYITCAGGRSGTTGSVAVMRTDTYEVIQSISLAPFAGTYNPVATPDGSYIYISNVTGNTISVVSTSDNALVETIGIGSSPRGKIVSPDGGSVYVNTDSSDGLLVFQRP